MLTLVVTHTMIDGNAACGTTSWPDSGAFPQQQSEAVIAHMQIYHNASTHNIKENKMSYSLSPLKGEYCLLSLQVTR